MNRFELKKEIVYKQLKERILSGELAEGRKLPKELDFSKELGVAKVTLRSALNSLREDGLIASIPSKGTFVLSSNRATIKTILCISANMDQKENPYLYMLSDAKSTAMDKGYECETCDISYINSLTEAEIVEIFKRRNIVAAILMAQHFTGNEICIAKLRATRVPVVIPHAKHNDTAITGFSSIVINEKSAWRAAVEYLVDQGHERIATITLSKKDIPFRGYTTNEHLRILVKCGAQVDKSILKQAPYEKKRIMAVVRELMRDSEPPSVILCFSDFIAIDVYDALKKMNLRIPEDVSVMGYCGFPGGAFLNPALTTIDLGYAQMAKMSVELAIKQTTGISNSKFEPVSIPHNHKLLLRESVARLRE